MLAQGLEVGMSIVELGLLYGMSELLVMQYEAGVFSCCMLDFMNGVTWTDVDAHQL